MEHESHSDEVLVSAYLEGDEGALEVLADRYLSDVYRFALHLTGDAHIAEDVAQEAFVKAWNRIRTYRGGMRFRAWLFTITRNAAIDALRKKRDVAFSSFEEQDGENPFVMALADAGPLPDELAARAEDARFVARLLEELNPDYREVLTMRHSGNLTFEEIGSMLGRPLHTLKSQYRRAVAMLRRAVGVQAV